MSCTLSELITQVRACKTAETERARINEECALIRTALKEEATGKRRARGPGVVQYRERNMLKLMFVHMLGYSTHWAQMECVTMIASPHFHEKRAGYLGLMLLLDETAKVLTLVTHQLSRDLEDESPLVNSLALATIANISSADMARDLHRQVEKHLATGAPLTRKKAALTCIRLFKAAPDLIDSFIPRVVALLTDRTHATIMTGTTLMWHLTQIKPSVIPRFAKAVPHLVKLLKKLVSSTNVPNYTIGGVCDPFLQSRLLTLLRVLGRGNAAASEAMNDVLAKVATHTDASRTAGNAILYDAVQCILDVESEEGLRVLAVNILGRFLLSKENNIQYVALNTLCNIVGRDIEAVGRHRATIVSCLSNADSSLRRRALDLVYALTDKSNILEMAGHMINYAVIAEADERPTVCARITSAVRRFAPSMRWEADALLVLIAVRGESARRDVVRRLIYLITAAPGAETQASLAHKVTEMLVENMTTPDCQSPLLLVAAWVIGEFAEDLLAEAPALPSDTAEMIIPVGPRGHQRSHAELVTLLGSLLTHHKATTEIRGIALTAITKLLVKTAATCPAEVMEAGREFLGMFSASLNQELQARSVEFLTLTSGDVSSAILDEVVEPIPVLTHAAVKKLRWGAEAAEQADLHGVAIDDAADLLDGEVSGAAGSSSADGGAAGAGSMRSMATESATAADAEASEHAASTQALTGGADGDEVLLDLFGTPMPSDSPPAAAETGSEPPVDLFGGVPVPAVARAGAAASGAGAGSAPAPAKAIDVAALFAAGPGGMMAPPATASSAVAIPGVFPEVDAMAVGGVRVTLQVARDPSDPTAATITLRAYRAESDSTLPITGVVVESAVAKYMTQSVGAPDGRVIHAGSAGPVTRSIRVVNPAKASKPFKLMLRAQCDGTAGKVTAKADVTSKLPREI